MPEAPGPRKQDRFFRLVIPADPSELSKARRLMEEVGQAAELPEARLFDLQVAVSEAAGNAIEHAASEVGLSAWLLADRVIVEVTNDGVFQPGLYKDDEHRRRGLGLPLMVALADQVHISRVSSGKTQVSLTFFLGGGRQPDNAHARPSPDSALALLEAETMKLSALSQEREQLLAEMARGYEDLAVSHMELEKSESLLRAVTEGTSDMIFVKDRESRLLMLNPATARTIGKRADELLGKNDAEFFDPETARRILEIDQRVMDGGRAEVVEEVVDTPEGRRIFLTTKTPRLDAGGRVIGLTGVGRDITERKQIEESLRLTQLSVDRTADLVHWVASDGRLVYANDSSCRRFGYSPEEMLTKTVFDLDTTMTPQAWPEHWQELKSRGSMTFESVHRTKEGQLYPVEVTVNYFDSGGKEHNVAFARDITERKRAEEALFKLNRTLKALSDNNQALVRTTDESTYLEEVCRIIVEDCGRAMVWIGYAEDDEAKSVRVVASAGFEEGYLETFKITWSDSERGRGPTGTAIRTRKPSICRNMLTDPSFAPWREDAVKRGYASSIAVPLMAGESAFGAIAIYSRQPDSFSEDEVNLLRDLADDLAIGITTLRLRATHAEAEKERELLIAQLQEASEELAGSNEELQSQTEELAVQGKKLEVRNEELRVAQQETGRLLDEQSALFRRLQETLLDIPRELPGVKFGHLYRSATQEAQVGGDFYDVFAAKHGQVALLIGDVSGHGVEAARIATLVKDTVHAFAHQFRRPHLVLRETNRLLVEKNLPGFVTVFLGFLDPDTGMLIYSSAGHPAPLLATDGQITLLESISSPLGVFADARYRDSETELEEGSPLLLYTDGITEARSGDAFFGEHGLMDCLERLSAQPVAALPSLLLDEVLLFSGGRLQDDAAMLAVRYVRKSPSQKAADSFPDSTDTAVRGV